MRSVKNEKNRKAIKIIGAIILVLAAIFAVRFWIGRADEAKKNAKPEGITDAVQGVAEGINIRVFSPTVNSLVSSPLKISGEANGWYAEASFPIKLIDEKGNILAKGEARAIGEWMSSDYVPFEAELKFDAGEARKGDLVFEKSNPSGKPENAGSFSFGILFKR